jgi:hypothetical protein
MEAVASNQWVEPTAAARQQQCSVQTHQAAFGSCARLRLTMEIFVMMTLKVLGHGMSRLFRKVDTI